MIFVNKYLFPNNMEGNNLIIIAIEKEDPLEEEHQQQWKLEQENLEDIVKLIEIIIIILGMIMPLKDIIPVEVIKEEN